MPIALRPAAAGELEALEQLLAAREQADGLARQHWRRLVLEQWGAAQFDPVHDAVVAEDSSRTPVGFAALFEQGGFAAVHPDREGEGAGTELLGWLERPAAKPGHKQHRQLIAATNARAHELLAAAGYRPVRSYLRMSIDLSAALGSSAPPSGISFEAPDPEADEGELHTLDDVAFAGNADYTPHSPELFRQEHLAAGRLAPDLSLVARRAGRAVGMALCQRWPGQALMVDILAVAPEERRRGLGWSLLRSSFRIGAEAGLRQALLDVASDNITARALYEHAGMVEAHRTDVLEKQA